MPRSSFALVLVIALVACGDESDPSTLAAIDTSGLDGLPDVSQPDIEATDTVSDVPDATQTADVPEPSDVEPDTTETTDTTDTADVPEPSDVEPDTTETTDTTPQPSDVEPPDTTDTTDTTDTADVSEPSDVGPDTGDTGVLDTTSPNACTDCLAVGVGPTDVTITNQATADAPTLDGLINGSNSMRGTFELDAITVYTKGAFDGFLISSATVANSGQTSGTVRFEDDRWAFFLDLDLVFNAQTVLGPNSGGSRNVIQGGGCYTLTERHVVGDTSTCANGWPSGTNPPEEAEFTYDASSGRFLLKVVLSREFVLALIPPEYAFIANSAITGPIRFIVVFSPRP